MNPKFVQTRDNKMINLAYYNTIEWDRDDYGYCIIANRADTDTPEKYYFDCREDLGRFIYAMTGSNDNPGIYTLI